MSQEKPMDEDHVGKTSRSIRKMSKLHFINPKQQDQYAAYLRSQAAQTTESMTVQRAQESLMHEKTVERWEKQEGLVHLNPHSKASKVVFLSDLLIAPTSTIHNNKVSHRQEVTKPLRVVVDHFGGLQKQRKSTPLTSITVPDVTSKKCNTRNQLDGRAGPVNLLQILKEERRFKQQQQQEQEAVGNNNTNHVGSLEVNRRSIVGVTTASPPRSCPPPLVVQVRPPKEDDVKPPKKKKKLTGLKKDILRFRRQLFLGLEEEQLPSSLSADAPLQLSTSTGENITTSTKENIITSTKENTITSTSPISATSKKAVESSTVHKKGVRVDAPPESATSSSSEESTTTSTSESGDDSTESSGSSESNNTTTSSSGDDNDSVASNIENPTSQEKKENSPQQKKKPSRRFILCQLLLKDIELLHRELHQQRKMVTVAAPPLAPIPLDSFLKGSKLEKLTRDRKKKKMKNISILSSEVPPGVINEEAGCGEQDEKLMIHEAVDPLRDIKNDSQQSASEGLSKEQFPFLQLSSNCLVRDDGNTKQKKKHKEPNYNDINDDMEVVPDACRPPIPIDIVVPPSLSVTATLMRSLELQTEGLVPTTTDAAVDKSVLSPQQVHHEKVRVARTCVLNLTSEIREKRALVDAILSKRVDASSIVVMGRSQMGIERTGREPHFLAVTVEHQKKEEVHFTGNSG